MPLLAIENLRKTYRTPDGETQVVLDVPGFVLEEKQQLALRGTSGTGKTTLLNCIAGILSPNSGRITLAGHDMGESSEGQRDRLRAENIGYIFQTFNLLQGYTCMENVLLGMSFGRGADSAAAMKLLQRVDLETGSTTVLGSFLSGSSSAWPWRARWQTDPSWCWPMNQPAIWIPRMLARH